MLGCKTTTNKETIISYSILLMLSAGLGNKQVSICAGVCVIKAGVTIYVCLYVFSYLGLYWTTAIRPIYPDHCLMNPERNHSSIIGVTRAHSRFIIVYHILIPLVSVNPSFESLNTFCVCVCLRIFVYLYAFVCVIRANFSCCCCFMS